MTEDEAKTKWCPFSRASGYGAANRFIHRDDASAGIRNLTPCIGSACMAWRARHQWFDNAQPEPEWVSYQPYAFEPGPGQERDDGFCGLAGEPR